MVCLIFSTAVFGQVSSENSYSIAPKFNGNKDATATMRADNKLMINNFLKENLVCPKEAAECCKEGTEIIEFTVTKTGDLNDFKVINSICPDLDKEVIRVLKTTNGMWTPGLENGEPTAMRNEVSLMLGDYSESTIGKNFIHEATRNFKAGNKNFLVKNNPGKAIHFYNRAINYLPNEKALLSMRGLCHYALGDKESANRDWNRIVALGESNSLKITDDITAMKGYQEMKEILAKNKEN